MRIIDVRQQSEEWEKLRLRPTASQFHRIITPKTGKLSAQSWDYAFELVARENDTHDEGPPSYWMDRGLELEDEALALYSSTRGVQVERVGFVVPDHTDLFGCSPDGLVGRDGQVEIKCPKAENLLAFKCGRKLPSEHRPQVQGQLLITGRSWCDVFVYHPAYRPVTLRVEADVDYQKQILAALEQFLVRLKEVREAADPIPLIWSE